MKKSTVLIAAVFAVATATAFAELPDAATALARIEKRRQTPPDNTETNGPSLQSLYDAYLALPLNAAPEREAEGWFALLDHVRTTGKYDEFRSLCDWPRGVLMPLLRRVPSAEAWPAIREGLATRADDGIATNAVPLVVALQYVFDTLAHDAPPASNRLERLRAAASVNKGAKELLRQFERGLNRKGRLPPDVESYIYTIIENNSYAAIPSLFLRLPQDRLWQLTAPVLTNNHFRLISQRGNSGKTPRELLSIGLGHADELAANSGYDLVDHTPEGRKLYDALGKRFDFKPPLPASNTKGNDNLEDEDLDSVADSDGGLDADALTALVARSKQRARPSKPDWYGAFAGATVRVLRGIMQREGSEAAFSFAANFPTNFFWDEDVDFTDGGVAEMDFLEKFFFDAGLVSDRYFSKYVKTAMRCGQTARAREKLNDIQRKNPHRKGILQNRLRLAAFDDDMEAIGALSREFRESQLPELMKNTGYSNYDKLDILDQLWNLLSVTTNRAELAAQADLIMANEEFLRDTYGTLSLVAALGSAGLDDKAFELALMCLHPGTETPREFYEAVLPLYHKAGRHRDIVDILEGDPGFAATNALQLLHVADGNLAEIYAEALQKVGRGADAATIARMIVLAEKDAECGDWPFRILVDEMESGAFIGLMDSLYAADRFEERPLVWKAEALRRAGKLEEAEAAARLAVETDPTDGETRAGDRIRSYAVLADILEARGKAKEAEFLRSAVKAVRIAEEGDTLQECGLVRRSLAKYEEAEKYFSAAYCVQWRKAERLRELGLVEQASRHYEETFRQLPAQFGFVASLCFDCSVFDSPGSIPIAERILTEAASGETPAPTACHLLGMLREKQERYDEAFKAYSRAVELAPDYLDALVALNGLRFHVRRPRAEWERIQARIFTLDPLGRHVPCNGMEIIDWGLAKRLESEALRKLPAPDFDSLRRIVFPASNARHRKDDESSHDVFDDDDDLSLEAQFYLKSSGRPFETSSFATGLSDLVESLMGIAERSQRMYGLAPSIDIGDDFLF